MEMEIRLLNLNYELICDAAKGCLDALEKILLYYDRYIDAVCSYERFDENGRILKEIDLDMKIQIQLKLVEAIKKWRELP
jgi:hypothetical protein